MEPTFDWTLRQKETGVLLAHGTQEALYNHLFQPDPVAFALARTHALASQPRSIHDQTRRAYGEGKPTLDIMLATTLMARDRESLVVLDDPAVTLPPLAI